MDSSTVFSFDAPICTGNSSLGSDCNIPKIGYGQHMLEQRTTNWGRLTSGQVTGGQLSKKSFLRVGLPHSGISIMATLVVVVVIVVALMIVVTIAVAITIAIAITITVAVAIAVTVIVVSCSSLY